MLPVRIGLRIEGLVCAHIADDARALVREAGKREGLAHLKDLVSVYFVPE